MKTSTAILIAVALTTFVLVLAGSLVWAINSKTVSSELAAQDLMGGAQSGSGEQIVEQSAPTRTTQPTMIVPDTASPTLPPPPTQPKIVSADHAAQIALRLTPGSSLQQPPELVNYKGTMAFEVLLNTATVYVDAFNGKVLASNAVIAQNQQPPTDTGSPDNGGGEQGRDPNPPPDPGVTNDTSQNEPPQSSSNHDDDEHDGGEHDGGEHDGGEHDGDDN